MVEPFEEQQQFRAGNAPQSRPRASGLAPAQFGVIMRFFSMRSDPDQRNIQRNNPGFAARCVTA
jgi:hypothetical protein